MEKLLKSDNSCEEKNMPNDDLKGFMIVAAAISLVLCLLLFFSGCAQAYTMKDAVRTIVGEASNQGYKGMVCVAEVIRHSASLKGFYGFKAMQTRQEPAWVWKMATKAYYASAMTNYTAHADHFENVTAFGHPYWVNSCVKVFAYKNHVFYKERKTYHA